MSGSEPGSAGDAARQSVIAANDATDVREIWCAVLGVSMVAAGDSFFALGGNSVQAARVVSEVRQGGLDVTLSDLFEAATLDAFEARVRAAGGLHSEREPAPVHVPRDDIMAPSLAQERYCALHADPLLPQFAPALMHIAFRVRGRLDAQRLAAAVRLVVLRHEMLRTGFHRVGNRFVARIAPSPRLDLRIGALNRAPAETTGAAIGRMIKSELARGFDREAPPLFRARLAEVTKDDWVLVLVMDHLIADGWSLSVLLRDVATAYEALATQPTYRLPPVEYQFADWAHWQRRLLSGPRLAKLGRHWRAELGTRPQVLRTSFPGYVSVPAAVGVAVRGRLDNERARAWRALAGQKGTTLYGLILTGLMRALAADVGPGRRWVLTSVGNRGPAWTASIVGALSHTTYLCIDTAAASSFDDVLDRATSAVAGLDVYGVLPNSLVREMVWPKGYRAVPGIPMVYFVVNPSLSDDLALSDCAVTALRTEASAPMNGVEFWVTDGADGLDFELWFRENSLDPVYVRGLLSRSINEIDQAIGTGLAKDGMRR
jgi:aryl carrier-like protein